MTLVEIANKLDREGIFTGGAPHLFESAGRLQLSTLVREGLYPSSRILDIGCGCLRAGFWLIRLLDPGCYFGIEPNQQMLQAGIEHVLGPELQAAKRPSFDTNDRFDSSVFGVKFDVFLARSIWTHAAKSQIKMMLDDFVQNSTPDAFFLTSYYPTTWFGRGAADYTGSTADYIGTNWIGRSHTSSTPGMVCHKRSWIAAECRARGLHLRQLGDPPFNGQYWLRISREPKRAAERS
jgi:SAM-dependent methyltransferase